MSNKKEIIKIIKEKIKLNIPKVEIEKELVSKYKVEEFIKILADFPEPELKQKYKKHNTALIICLVLIMLFRLADVFDLSLDFGGGAMILFIVLVFGIPAYLINGLRFYRKSFYGIIIILSIASLGSFLRAPENFQYIYNTLEFIIVLVTTIISIFLFRKIYPKKLIAKEQPLVS